MKMADIFQNIILAEALYIWDNGDILHLESVQTLYEANQISLNRSHNRKLVQSRADWKTEAIPTKRTVVAFVVVPTRRDETKGDLFSRENGLQRKL